MIAPNPDLSIRDCEAQDMVDEGFGFASAFWNAEDVGQQFFDGL